MSSIVGLDVHSKETVFCVQKKGSAEVVRRGRFPTTREGMAQWILEQRFRLGTQMGLEAGVSSFWVSRFLKELGMEPVVLKANEVRAKARRLGQKTDARDAFEICDGLRRDIFVARVYVPDAGIQRLRDLLSRRRHLVRIGTRQINATRFVLRARGISDLVNRLESERSWEQLLKAVELETFCDLLTGHDAIWRETHRQIQALEKAIEEASEPYAEILNLLESVPGVGKIVSTTFLATVGNPERFPDGRHVASYLGLVPSQYDSGEKERPGKITKEGSSECRSMLVEAAHQASRKSSPLHRLFCRHLVRHGYRKAVVTIASHLARLLYAIWTQGKPFDATRWKADCTPAEKVKKTKRYKLVSSRK